jgi:uncharacterized oxidoreductase
MKTQGNTVLITGGATGFGFSLAKTFVNAGNTVIICGRRQSKLREAKDMLPQLHIRVCDVSDERERELLFLWVEDKFSDINVVVNNAAVNAGVPRMVNLKDGIQDISSSENEIRTNLVAPIRLSAHFIPLLLEKRESAIINVTSGLAFVPAATMPVYCATKAALHSFTVSLRFQLRHTSIKVFEIMPPLMATDLGKIVNPDGSVESRGIPPSEAAEAVMAALENDHNEIPVGEAKKLIMGALTNPERTFENINQY